MTASTVSDGSDGSRHPNILFILSDQHNPMVTRCYGDPVVDTPNLDSLAAEGVLLDTVYSASPLCAPARMSLLTGRHPHQNQVWDNDHVLSSAIPAFTHAMGAAGYVPHLVGRLHARGPDQLVGYADRKVGDHGPGYVGAPPAPRGDYKGTAGPEPRSLELSGVGQSGYQVRDEHAAAEAIAFLDRVGIDRRAGLDHKPFSLTVGLMLPHPPYIARAEDYRSYEGRVPPPRTQSTETDPAFIRWWRADRKIPHVPEDQVTRARTAYWACVHRMDAIIGSILDALRHNNLDQDTIIVYTSDHGDHVGEHGLWWKHTFYEGSVRIPGIIRWPGVVPAGGRCDRVVSALDITATMVDAATGARLPGSSGRSLLPLLRSETAEWDDVAFSEAGPVGTVMPQRMIRKDRWKLCYYYGHPLSLFDLEADPDETLDLADDPASEAIVMELSEQLFDGWDPEAIRSQLVLKQEELAVLDGWWKTVRAAEPYRWDLDPAATYLDRPATTPEQGES